MLNYSQFEYVDGVVNLSYANQKTINKHFLWIQVKHSQDIFPGSNAFILITCMQVTSGVGRLVFGKIADFQCVNRVYMQQCAFVVMGIVTACIPFSASFEGLIAICLILGICDGVFVCLLGPIAFDIVGPMEASQAIGFMLGGFSLPLTVGPPIAGLLSVFSWFCLLKI